MGNRNFIGAHTKQRSFPQAAAFVLVPFIELAILTFTRRSATEGRRDAESLLVLDHSR